MWFEEMGLIFMPQIKTREEFAQRLELLLRRLASEQIMSRVVEPKTVEGDDEH